MSSPPTLLPYMDDIEATGSGFNSRDAVLVRALLNKKKRDMAKNVNFEPPTGITGPLLAMFAPGAYDAMTKPIEGANPEAPTPASALVGLEMSGGGVPGEISRAGGPMLRPTVNRARGEKGPISIEGEFARTKAPEAKPGEDLVGRLADFASRKTARMRREGEEGVGGLANTSKLECQSWGIPAKYCQTGGKLRETPGTVCHNCYAQGETGSGKNRQSRYSQSNVQKANERRFQAYNSDPESWVKDMSIALQSRPLHRWFDSGDLQSVEMLNNIVEVAKKTPGTQHWLPTKERPFVDRWLKAHPEGFPENLQVRISLPMIGQLPENYQRHPGMPSAALPVAGAWPKSDAAAFKAKAASPDRGNLCPAPLQGGSCNPKTGEGCRRCFGPNDVTYLEH